MGLFSGRRAVDDTPQRAMTLPFDWSVLTAGATITDYSSVDANGENALRSIAVGASIDLICSLASELAVDVFRGEGSQRQKLTCRATCKTRRPVRAGAGSTRCSVVAVPRQRLRPS